MTSDVKLQGEQVRLEAWDLVLDAADRRKSTDGDRRALVHDNGDALALNWGHDYPGGVRLYGVRLITKDPNFITGVTIDGGLHLGGGSLLIKGGNKLLLSDANPGDDFVSGEIYQTDDGLHVTGGQSATVQKPVALQTPVARKAIKWGEWPPETVNRVGNRTRPAGRGSAVTLAAGAALTATRTMAMPSRGAVSCEFDIVDTFIQILDELSDLRQRVLALEAAANG